MDTELAIGTRMHDLLRHEALVYRGHDQFVSSSVTLLRDGLDRDERLIFLARQIKIDDVREALGDDAVDVALVPTDEHGRNPSRITTILDGFRHGNGDGRRVLGLTEPVVAGSSPEITVEAEIADNVLNSPQLQTWPMSVVCLYDAGSLDDESLRHMRRSHPVVRGENDDNDDFDVRMLSSLFAAPLSPAPPDAARLEVFDGELSAVREFVRRHAVSYRVAADRVDDLVLAVNEIATNSMKHAGGRATMRMWFANGSAVCEISDAGRLHDALVGRFAPSADAPNGRGLWLANHLCDLVQIRSSAVGTVVRLYVDR